MPTLRRARAIRGSRDSRQHHPSRIMILLGVLLVACTAPSFDAAQPWLQLVQTIPLAGVEGRIDHLAVDVSGQRLFVAALGNNTLEVADLRAGRHLLSVPGMREPQGVAFLPDRNQIIVANGGDGQCVVLDGSALRVMQRVPCGDDADNVRYDQAAGVLYVGTGRGRLTVLA